MSLKLFLHPLIPAPTKAESTMQNAEILNELTLSVVLRLPQQAELETVQALLEQVSPRIVTVDCPVLKPELRQFIVWALQQSHAENLSAEEKLKLLDIAWEVQSLLWRTR